MLWYLYYVSIDTILVGWGCPASTASNIELSRAFQAQGQEFHAEEESDHDQPSRPGGDPDAAWLEVGKAIKGPVIEYWSLFFWCSLKWRLCGWERVYTCFFPVYDIFGITAAFSS